MISTHIDPFLAFCKDIQIPGCEVHLYRGPSKFGMILCEHEGCFTLQNLPDWWQTENVYFLPGVMDGLRQRAADNDVKKRGMFTLDFDIRKELEQGWKERDAVSPEDQEKEIMLAAENIIGKLEPHPMWGQMRYVVMSGNGMHVHYFGKPATVVKEEWSAGMKEVFAEIEELTEFPPDYGCGNAGRIMRMPGSWNVKDPEHKKKVDFAVWMPAYSLPPLQFVQERGKVAIARQNERKEQERRDFVESGKQESDLIALINCIPIEQVVKMTLGCEVKSIKKDGGMRFGDDKGVERGFFKHHAHNVIVHEGTSLFPPPTGVGYNCLGLARVILGLSTHDTIEWFCDRSPRCRDVQKEERARWAKQMEEEGSHEFIDLMGQPSIDESAESSSFESTISTPHNA